MANINRVVIIGNLTSSPEVSTLPSGTVLCRLRVACTTRRRQPDGSWADKPNYFDVVVWGAQGEAAGRILTKGAGVAVDGRLDWREWTTGSGEKRQGVEIIADTVQFLDGPRRPSGEEPSTGASGGQPPEDDVPF